MNRVIYRVSNVYLSCIYRICNVVDSGRVAGDNRSLAGRAVDGSSLRVCEIFTTVEGTDLALKKGSPTSKLRSRNAAHTTDTHTFFENMDVSPH